MGKKSKDEAAAIRDKAIERFLKLRAKVEGLRKSSASACEDRDSAHHLLEKYKAELAYIDSCRLPPGRTKEEAQGFADKFAKDREEIVVKIERYVKLKEGCNRRYFDSVDKWTSFGSLIDRAKKAVVELGFMSQEEVR